MTDVIDGPHGPGQPVRDELPAAQLPAPAPRDGDLTANPAPSASNSFDTRPLIMESATLPLMMEPATLPPRRRLTARGRPERQPTVVLTPAALPSQTPAPEAPASDTQASKVQAPGGLTSVAPAGKTPADVAAPAASAATRRSRPGQHHDSPVPESTGGKS